MHNLKVIKGSKRETIEHSFEIGPEELLAGEIYLKHVCQCLGVDDLSDLHRARLVTHLFQQVGLYVTNKEINVKLRDAEKCGTAGEYDPRGNHAR